MVGTGMAGVLERRLLTGSGWREWWMVGVEEGTAVERGCCIYRLMLLRRVMNAVCMAKGGKLGKPAL